MTTPERPSSRREARERQPASREFGDEIAANLQNLKEDIDKGNEFLLKHVDLAVDPNVKNATKKIHDAFGKIKAPDIENMDKARVSAAVLGIKNGFLGHAFNLRSRWTQAIMQYTSNPDFSEEDMQREVQKLDKFYLSALADLENGAEAFAREIARSGDTFFGPMLLEAEQSVTEFINALKDPEMQPVLKWFTKNPDPEKTLEQTKDEAYTTIKDAIDSGNQTKISMVWTILKIKGSATLVDFSKEYLTDLNGRKEIGKLIESGNSCGALGPLEIRQIMDFYNTQVVPQNPGLSPFSFSENKYREMRETYQSLNKAQAVSQEVLGKSIGATNFANENLGYGYVFKTLAQAWGIGTVVGNVAVRGRKMGWWNPDTYINPYTVAGAGVTAGATVLKTPGGWDTIREGLSLPQTKEERRRVQLSNQLKYTVSQENAEKLMIRNEAGPYLAVLIGMSAAKASDTNYKDEIPKDKYDEYFGQNKIREYLRKIKEDNPHLAQNIDEAATVLTNMTAQEIGNIADTMRFLYFNAPGKDAPSVENCKKIFNKNIQEA